MLPSLRVIPSLATQGINYSILLLVMRISSAFLIGFVTLTLYATDANSQSPEKTTFQTGGVWKPTTDIRSDVAIVYGVSDRPGMTFEQRVRSWHDRGYATAFMTGIAWGNYQEYFTGKWDGKPHFDEGQKEQNGDTIWHGRLTPYIVPTKNFLTYFRKSINNLFCFVIFYLKIHIIKIINI